MDEADFDGTIVLERLAEIGRVDEFFEAIDSDDVERAVALMRQAGVDRETIAIVVRKIEQADSQH
jgi:hypothetical protein